MNRIAFSLAFLWLGSVAAPAGTPAVEVGMTSAKVKAADASDTNPALVWPAAHRENRPWAYWWWMGSAVDPTNLTHELQRYHDAGMGGVHIIPIYGAKGYEDRFIDYLSPKWMDLLAWTVTEAGRLDLGVDMTAGSGWCFGGPHVTDLEANALAVVKTYQLDAGGKLAEKLSANAMQALVAFSSGRKPVDLTSKLAPDGTLDWSPESGSWRVYAVSQRPSGVKVKRAGPGGQGHMLNLIYPEAMKHYLAWFETAFANYGGPKPRALYHDSYEYRSDWAPDFFASFEQRRGYRLQAELPALFGPSSINLSSDHIARVKCDYRETISDVMVEDTLPAWTAWAHQHGFITRNEAHGSPGNWLDLYAAADIPETEMFNQDRNKLVSKFASSAAHLSGRNLVASETGTWLKEHFTGTLADMKYLVDDMFLSGINHIFYHGTCYSPDDAPWPGWAFYASFDMNPRNSIWRDVSALNAYETRCQSVLQSGQPDNDILLYWPIHDFWQNPVGSVRPMTVHAREWLEDQPVGKVADWLWNRGYAFDYVSDRLLASATAEPGRIKTPGGTYQVLVVPSAKVIPLETMRHLAKLAEQGAAILFESRIPEDVPGLARLAERRAELARCWSGMSFPPGDQPGLIRANLGAGRILAGELQPGLAAAGVRREPMFDHPGLMCVRRVISGACYYFIANRSNLTAIKDWLPLSTQARSALIMDPLTGRSGSGSVRPSATQGVEIYLELEPGQSLIVGCGRGTPGDPPVWEFPKFTGAPLALQGTWQVQFMAGGPELPAPFEAPALASWTSLADTKAQTFAGAARYCLTFDAPADCQKTARLDLGKVCHSARVRLNGDDLGTLFIPPFQLVVHGLKPAGNRLEVEVTSTSANRIRDLDRRGVKWRNFYDINVVNLDYKPFDASPWPLADAGLLGPVTLTAGD